ncbi:MAG: copper-binding protein [Gemmatimonadales bacterium]
MRVPRFSRSTLAAAAIIAAVASVPADPGGRRHVVIRIRGLRYSPDTLMVSVGDTITWQNDDVVPHTVTASRRSWDSGLLSTGDRYTLVVTDSTPDRYRCRFHPEMVATLRRK